MRFGGHDNDGRVGFPDHAPKIGDGRAEWALARDVLLWLGETRHIVGVDVVRTFFVADRFENHPRVVKGHHIAVPVLLP